MIGVRASPFRQLDRFTAVKLSIVLLAVLAFGCSQTQSVDGPSPCLLPISIADAQGNFQGAFVSFPGGQVTSEASGVGGQYYDLPFARWLPVNRNAVSTDGTRYAYLDRKVPGTPGQARLHVVNVPTGFDKAVDLGAPGDTSAYRVVSFATEGIWLSYAGYESPGAGLFLFDAGMAAMKDVAGPEILEPVAGGPGVFWFTDGGPNPQSSAGMGSIIPARMQRLTIWDNEVETWFSEPGSSLTVFGTDLAGHAIFTDGKDVILALSPNETKVIGLPQGFYRLLADRRGVWFGGDQGIYLYSASGHVQKVSSQAGSPAGTCA